MNKLLFAVGFLGVVFFTTHTPVLGAPIPDAVYEYKVDEAIGMMLRIKKDDHAPCFVMSEKKQNRRIYCDVDTKYDFEIHEKDTGIEIEVVSTVRQEIAPNLIQPYTVSHGRVITQEVLRKRADILLGLVYGWQTLQGALRAAEGEYQKFSNTQRIIFETLK